MKRNQMRGGLVVLLMALALAYSAFALAQSYVGPLFETHAHIVPYQSESSTEVQYRVDAREAATELTVADYVASLDRNNITCTLGFHGIAFDGKQQELLDHATRLLDLYPDRFILFAEIFRDNPLGWYDSTSLDLIFDEGLFAGFGEAPFAHYPLGPDDDHSTTTQLYPNDPFFQPIYTLLGDRGLFMMAHPKSRQGLADAISYDPDVTWIIHGPQVHSSWSITDTDGDGIPDGMEALENLLNNHSNLYYTLDIAESLRDFLDLTKVMDPTTGKADFLDAMNDDPTFNDLLDQMVSTWKDVIERHPDRFLWGTDMALPTWHWDPEVIDKIAEFSRAFIGRLESSAGENYAYKNAERLLGGCPDQGGEIQFSSASYGVDEGVGSATITVQRTGLTARTVAVDYATSSGTATEGSDYVAASGTLTFGPGETSKSFAVPIVNDSEVEGNETINLTLSNPTRGATLGTTSTAVLTIANNDVSFRFKDASYSVSEHDGTATIRVEKLGGTPETVTVNYSTSGGTAIAGTDYDAATATGTLTFAPGDPGIKTFSITILNNNTADGDRTLILTLANPTNPRGAATLGSPATALLTIRDDDFNTPAGTNVQTTPVDSTTGTTPVSVTFANVTQAGTTSLTTSSSGPASPSGFQLGSPPTYYEITTTALYSGSITVCINYSGVSFDDESNLRLYHLESGVWVDQTVSLDTTNDIICASASSLSPFAIFEPIPIPVTIDIKPGSFPNSINLGSGGTVPVAIFSTQTFDARTLTPSTITLASAPVKLKGQGTPMASFQDVNGDGLLDVVVHVSTETLQLSDTDTAAVLRGKTSDGRVVKGTDSVRVVP